MFWGELVAFFRAGMTVPTLYGWFHLLFFGLSIGVGVLLCVFCKDTQRYARRIVFVTAALVALLEIYKMITFTYSYEDGVVTGSFQWYAFPWQFCSTPMYVGLLTGLFRRGRVHEALCAYLATFALFAGLCVMFYPADVFINIIGINIQTMICHGSMLSVGIYLLYTGYVRLEHKTILKAIPVFAAAVAVAMVLNEIAYRTGLLETHTFNMFFISPYCEPSLPVYSIVQQHVAYPWCLIIYIAAFSLAAYLLLLIAMGIRALAHRCRRREKRTV